MEVIETADPHANVGTLLLNLEYFKGDTSSMKDFDKSDKGTAMKKEQPKTTTVNLKVTSTKFNRSPFTVMIQVLTLSFLIMCQAGKVSDMSSLWHLLHQQRAVLTCVFFSTVQDAIRNNESPIRKDEQAMQV